MLGNLSMVWIQLHNLYIFPISVLLEYFRATLLELRKLVFSEYFLVKSVDFRNYILRGREERWKSVNVNTCYPQ